MLKKTIKTSEENIDPDSNLDIQSNSNQKKGLFDDTYRKRTLVSMTLAFSGVASIMQNIAPLKSEVGLDIDAGY